MSLGTRSYQIGNGYSIQPSADCKISFRSAQISNVNTGLVTEYIRIGWYGGGMTASFLHAPVVLRGHEREASSECS